MRHPPIPRGLVPVALPLAVAALVAACAAAGGPSGAPATGEPPTPVTGQVPSDLVIAAANIEWEPREVTVAAGVPFSIGFDNRDAGVPHDLVLQGPSGETIAQTEIIVGPASATLQVPALAPGTYSFRCEVHPNMVGALTAE